jgi:hypothetical protein
VGAAFIAQWRVHINMSAAVGLRIDSVQQSGAQVIRDGRFGDLLPRPMELNPGGVDPDMADTAFELRSALTYARP